MTTEYIISIILNLIYLGILIYLIKFLFKLNLAWWLRTQRTDTILKEFWPTLKYLEITLPADIQKSPQAMEFFFNAINQTLGHVEKDLPIKDLWSGSKGFFASLDELKKDYYKKYKKGSVRMWYSLEVASFEGQIRFYVVIMAKHAEIAKQYIYSQFPNIEIREVEDYLLQFEYSGNKSQDAKNLIYLGRYKLSNKDYLPIKTYVDYGLENATEEQKLDPLTPLLESMSSAGPGEYFFYQILVRATINDGWRKETEKRIDEILGIKRVNGKITEQTREEGKLSPKDRHELEILEKNIEKPGFDVITRFIYFAEKAKFSGPKGVFPVVNAMKSFNKEGYNKFDFLSATTDADFPFLDPKGIKTEGTRKFFWMLFKLRAGFYFEAEGDYTSIVKMPKIFFKKWRDIGFYAAKASIDDFKEFLFPKLRGSGASLDFVLNTEELATLYHFPGKTFHSEQSKILSTKGEPPVNLPV